MQASHQTMLDLTMPIWALTGSSIWCSGNGSSNRTSDAANITNTDLSENENGGHWQIGIVTETWQAQIAGHWQNDNTRFELQRSDTFFDLYNSQICMARRCGRPRFEHFPMMMHNRTPTNHRLYHHYARFLMVVINFVRPCPTLWGAHILLFQFLGR